MIERPIIALDFPSKKEIELFLENFLKQKNLLRQSRIWKSFIKKDQKSSAG